MPTFIVAGLNKRSTISVPNPNSPLSLVLAEFCKKHKLDPQLYELRDSKGKVLDLSLAIRLSGLPNNAKLDVRKSSKSKANATPTIGIQLPDNSRHQAKFTANTSLYDILLYWEVKLNTTLTRAVSKNKDKYVYCQPVLFYMNQQFKADALKNTTLQRLGIHDSGLFKLSYEETNLSIEEANEIIKQQEEEKQTMMKAIITAEETKQIKPKIEEPREKVEQKKIIPLQNTVAVDVKVFKTNTDLPYQSIEEDLPDEIFEATTDDIKMALAELQKRKEEGQILMTKKMRDLQKEKTKRVYDKALIRVRFPGQVLLQGTFKPQHTLKDVYDFVRVSLADPTIPFYLFVAPPVKRLEEMDKTLIELNLVPASLINIGCSLGKVAIKKEYMQYVQDVQMEQVPKNLNVIKEEEEKKKMEEKIPKTLGQSTKQSEKKVPSWFKMGK